ncbi:MAG: hypothetical protein Q4G22_13390 [Paracoccus sp. (in: a-proteobacteria)]|uniref:hypothetical protein n=1 Tax=Paracoccus sp. TaxID=267 RepID=UPI0026DF0509|nr:hypothetical protein [Paracoccus sp. (in: a-proteobacteria)]MDO5632812.1 hypothetical protein [Paracoccus sp. (in: a-proteobacteria)]
MKHALALILPLLLAACVPDLAASQQRPATPVRAGAEPIVIRNDRGGNVMQAIARRNQLAQSGRRVEVRGYCRSACTIYITLPNACLGPGARVGFHAPRIEGTTIIPPYVDQMMGAYYRNGIRDRWFGGWNTSRQMQIISAREYVKLDPQTKLCR